MKKIFILLLVFSANILLAQENTNQNKFKQLTEDLPTPNSYRSASGAPGHEYWQNEADYVIDLELDDDKQSISGKETITYHNNSPDVLRYFWVQLDQNVRALDSDSHSIKTNSVNDKMNMRALGSLTPDFDGGFKIEKVQTTDGKDIPHTINKTMMRVDIPKALKPGESYSFNIEWWYNINNRMEIGGRSGYEYFEENDNYLYTIAQFYPRMCMYNDVYGWQNKQFLGRGEFTLSFGDYKVSITVPSDHLVASTGILQNDNDVLTSEQRNRLKKAAKEYEQPVIIATQAEAEKRETKKSNKKQTWIFHAENVRDFAFASSRKFIWDAMAVEQTDGTKVMAMSMYPKEGNPLWEKYSTKAVAHTLKWYSHYTFAYPYPVAWSINAARIGMEYPMICFNYGRCEEDGTYSKRTKYGMISVIIHEVGHNYFPMIVNSDERQWTWMDEGLTTFLQYLTEVQWERDYPSRRGPAQKIVPYMGGDKSKISPIMTNSESIHQFGNNAYGKPATALNILRETVMGRELFDFAFKEYSNRWMFKHPTPADFFRTMEDASSVDLDWFWRGWFYTNDHVDISIDDVQYFKVNSKKPDPNAGEVSDREKGISHMRNKEEIDKTYDEEDPSLRDFYSTYDPFKESQMDQNEYDEYIESLSEKEKAVLDDDLNYYQIKLSNKGGLVMPVILEFEYADGTSEVIRIPAEIWKLGTSTNVSKVFAKEKEVVAITLDPFLETADTDTSNNAFPPKKEDSKFEMFERKQFNQPNEMQKAEKKKAERP